MSKKTEALRQLFLDVADDPTVTETQTEGVSHTPAEAGSPALEEALPAGDHAVLTDALEGAEDTSGGGTGRTGVDES